MKSRTRVFHSPALTPCLSHSQLCDLEPAVHVTSLASAFSMTESLMLSSFPTRASWKHLGRESWYLRADRDALD